MSDEIERLHRMYHLQSMLCRIGLLETMCFQSTNIDEYWKVVDGHLSYQNLRTIRT